MEHFVPNIDNNKSHNNEWNNINMKFTFYLQLTKNFD